MRKLDIVLPEINDYLDILEEPNEEYKTSHRECSASFVKMFIHGHDCICVLKKFTCNPFSQENSQKIHTSYVHPDAISIEAAIILNKIRLNDPVLVKIHL